MHLCKAFVKEKNLEFTLMCISLQAFTGKKPVVKIDTDGLY